LKKIEIVTRLVYWGQEKLFEEKTIGTKSRDTVPLRKGGEKRGDRRERGERERKGEREDERNI
jgi:hypothetical protein